MDTQSLNIEVAGLSIEATREDGPVRLGENDPHAAFLGPAERSEPECRVRVRTAPLPAPDEAPDLFHHRSQWRVRRGEGGWRLPLIFPPHRPALQRFAFASEDFATVDLLTSESDPRPHLPFAYLFAELLTLGLSARRPHLLFHAASLTFAERGVLALGASGAGKSTIATLADQAGAPWGSVGDESHLVTRDAAGQGFRLWGTPWPGSSGISKNASAPLAAILLLEHGQANALEPLAGAGAVARALAHAFLPVWSRPATDAATALAVAMTASVPVYRFAFRPDSSALTSLETLF